MIKTRAAKEITNPLLVFKRRVESVKRRAGKKSAKNKGTAPKEPGSIKKISKTKAAQSRIITRSVGRKFFLLFLISLFFFLAISISF